MSRGLAAMPVAVAAIVEPVWGWSVRVPGASVGGASLPLPPPSTLIGMLAYSLLISLEKPESIYKERGRRLVFKSAATLLLDAVITASAGLIEGRLVTAYDLLRACNIPYIRPENRRDPSQWFSVNAFGVTVAPGSRLCIALVVDEEVLRRLGVTRRHLEAAAWSMTRIGSKEGLASVVDAGVFDVERGGGWTRLYGAASFMEAHGSTVAMRVWDPWDDAPWSSPRQTPPRFIDLAVPLSLRGPVYEPVGEGEVVARKAWRLVGTDDLFSMCGVVPDVRG